MNRKRSAEILPKDQNGTENSQVEEYQLPPLLFQHQDLVGSEKTAHTVDRETLINMLNHIHFTDGYILVHLSHAGYCDSILVRAYPQPSAGKDLVCLWAESDLSELELSTYDFQHLLIGDGLSMVLVSGELRDLSGAGFTLRLPETSYAVGRRRARRHACSEVVAEVIQNGFVARGELLDFSTQGFRIRVRPEVSSSFSWFNREEQLTAHLRNYQRLLFSGFCQCVRMEECGQEWEMVLAPSEQMISRFKPNGTRNPRQHLVPSPGLVFDHPLLRKRMQLEVWDISTSGCSVYENTDEGVLLPGMIIPELSIDFAGTLRVECSAQVIYRREDGARGIRCGLAVLDMDIDSYSRLTHVLTNALDPHAYVSKELDMDALWEFFFKAGFIYPKKYSLIQSNKEDFKRVYQKLYQESPEIAKHFTYQKHGRIYGHISMVRAYEKTWLIHHHAAMTVENKRAGFIVLKQIMHYLNDMHRLPSAHMNFTMSYFRPENKFPDRVFGGFSRSLKNPKGCSTDLFAYLPYTGLSLGARLPESWSLRPCTARDRWELNRFYDNKSGGLLLEAMGLGQELPEQGGLEGLYKHLGFLRKREAYALVQEGDLRAVLVVNQSDLGFNLSELLNGIKIIVTSGDELPWNILSIAISLLVSKFNMNRVPVLFYPFEYVKAQDVPYEKQYQAWVLNVRYGGEYMEYMQKRFRISYA